MKRVQILPGLFLLLSLLGSYICQAQNREIDSLFRASEATKDLAKKSQLLNQASLSLIPTDIQKARLTAEKSIAAAKQSGNKLQLGWSILSEGICLQIEGENKLAYSRFEEILRLNKDLKNPSLEAYTVNLVANQLRDQGYFDSALHHYQKARAIMARVSDPQFMIVSSLELTRQFLILNDNDKALREVDAALAQINANRTPGLLREALLLKGIALLQQFNYAEAEYYLDRAQAISEPNSTTFLRVMVARGDILFQQGDFTGAIGIWKNILDAEKQIGYQFDLAMLLIKIAEAYSEQGFRKIAIEYLNTCLEISEKCGFDFLRSEVYFELAWADYRNGNFIQATKKLNISADHPQKINLEVWIAASNNLRGLIYMGRKMYDSSLYFHSLALKTRLQSNRKVAISSSLFNMGELFVNRKEFKKALEYLRRGLAIDESIHDEYGRSLYYYQLSRAHNGLKQTDSAKYYLMRSISMAAPNSAYEILRKSYLDMATMLQNTGETEEAIQYLEKYINIGDSLYNKQTAQTLAAYETLFEVDKKQKEIELLNKDKAITEANNRIQQILLYLVGTGLILMIFLAIFYKRNSARLKVLNKVNEQKAAELSEANSSLQKLYSDLQNNNNELKETLDKLSQAQNQLLKSEKMASLGILAAGVAHELNNPLNYIKGGVTTLEIQASKSGTIQNPEFKNSFSIIQEGVSRATAIIKGLGQYSRQTEKMTESCDLNKIIENCLVILSSSLKYHVKVIRDYSPDTPVIIGNEGKLHQAFINILSNAEQAITGEGTITVSTRSTETIAEVSISDTGSGMSNENLKRLGDLFFTTKEPGKGTGLGLSISYKIIEEHQGKIHVESELGKGTTFILSFNK